MPRAVQRATAADVPYSMSSGCATTQSTRWKDSSGEGRQRLCRRSFQNCSRRDGPAGRVQLAPARADLRPVAADDPGHIGTGSGQMRVIVVIASSTRGFTTPRDGTPPVINPCPSTQDQDEKASLSEAGSSALADIGHRQGGVRPRSIRCSLHSSVAGLREECGSPDACSDPSAKGGQSRSGYRFMLRGLGELASSDREWLYQRGSPLCLDWQVQLGHQDYGEKGISHFG